MLATIGNVLLILGVAAGLGGGAALFIIAKQDDSRAGRMIGAAITSVCVIAALYLTLGNHWL